MFDHCRYRNIIAALVSVMPIFDLVRFARVNKLVYQCARREILTRIGPRNYELVAATDPLTAAPIAEVELRSIVRYNDLKFFYLEVADPAAYWPLAIALRSRYKDLGVNIGTGDECDRADIDSIFIHWIHVGLVGCARLLFIGDTEETAYDISRRCENTPKLPDDVLNVDSLDISALSQEQLVSAVYWNPHSKHVRAIVNALNHHHFNLLAEIYYRENSHYKSVQSALFRSNAAHMRYDPTFVDRTVAKFTQHIAEKTFATLPVGFEPEMSSVGESPLDKVRHCSACLPAPTHKHLSYHMDKSMSNECKCECHTCTCGGCLLGRAYCRRLILCHDCKCCLCLLYCLCPCECDAICKYSCTCCMCIYGCICYE